MLIEIICADFLNKALIEKILLSSDLSGAYLDGPRQHDPVIWENAP